MPIKFGRLNPLLEKVVEETIKAEDENAEKYSLRYFMSEEELNRYNNLRFIIATCISMPSKLSDEENKFMKKMFEIQHIKDFSDEDIEKVLSIYNKINV